MIKPRSRQVIAINIVNSDINEGFLPLLDSPEGVFVGCAAVSVYHGRCLALAINSTEESVELRMPPQELTPYDVFEEESDGIDEIIFSERTRWKRQPIEDPERNDDG